MKMARPAEDKVVCLQGDEGDAFYIVFRGSVSCYVVIEGNTRTPLPRDRPPMEYELHRDVEERAAMREVMSERA